MQVSHGKFGALDVDGEVDLAATGEILDVTVPAVLRTTGDCPGAFFPDFGFGFLVGGTRMDVLRLWRLGDDAREGGGRDQLGFPLVPLGKDLG